MQSIRSLGKYSLRQFELDDFPELVSMFKELTREIYPNRKIGADYFFYRSVLGWVQADKHIIIALKGEDIIGFSLCHIETSGITEPIYLGECAYVKPEYRRSKAAYLLYKNGSDKASELGLTLFSNAFIGGLNHVDKIQEKFGMKPMFIGYERSI